MKPVSLQCAADLQPLGPGQDSAANLTEQVPPGNQPAAKSLAPPVLSSAEAETCPAQSLHVCQTHTGGVAGAPGRSGCPPPQEGCRPTVFPSSRARGSLQACGEAQQEEGGWGPPRGGDGQLADGIGDSESPTDSGLV